MEFWGIEIKPGSPLKVEPEDGYIIHVSQVSLGDMKKVKEGENVPVYVKVGDDKQKLVVGNISQKIPQVSLDLFFEQEFEVSHACKSSVFLLGYKTPDVMDEEVDSEFDSDEEGVPMEFLNGGLVKSNPNGTELKPVESDDSDEEDESDSEMGSDEDDSSEEEEEKEAPLKVEPPSKKRPNGGAVNNNKVASKKAKAPFQQKKTQCCKH